MIIINHYKINNKKINSTETAVVSNESVKTNLDFRLDENLLFGMLDGDGPEQLLSLVSHN